MSFENEEWRQLLVARLKERNKRESQAYKDIIEQNNRLLDQASRFQNDLLRIQVEHEQLRSNTSRGGSESSKVNIQVASLEKKLLVQQEELMEMHRRKGENAQMIVDLNIKLDKFKHINNESASTIETQKGIINSLKAEINLLKTNMEELKGLNTIIRDEHTALQLAFGSLEEKLRSVQDENRALVDRIIKFKARDADDLNRENETFLKKRSDRVKRDLEEASRENRRNSSSPLPSVSSIASDCESICEDTISLGAPISMTGFYSDVNPNTIHLKFEAHDGEVNAIRWSPAERMVATGGADRKVKLWDVGKRLLEPRGMLVGSNASINSVDFDSTGTVLLGTSNDFATRVWTVRDHRLRHTLTGHSAKVMAAKFLQEPSKVITGSHDRTLKIWDLRSKACVETKFAGSSCNDLVTTDSAGSTIISGHFDKKIRFWDTRSDSSSNDVLMPAKITSLDLSKDFNYLLCCVRDDTIKLLDLRMNQIIGSFSDENFKVSCDWSRVSFNFNATKVAAGSADGSILIWNTCGKLETTLKSDPSAAVNAVSWNPTSSVIASVGKTKSCSIWLLIAVKKIDMPLLDSACFVQAILMALSEGRAEIFLNNLSWGLCSQ